MSAAQRIVVWRSLDEPSMEFFTLRQSPDGWRMAGTVVAVVESQPLRVTYAIDCSDGWRTRHVEVSVADPDGERTLSLVAAGDGSWQAGGQALGAVNGCVDVDLAITPATNTLPIRRLNLAVGESAAVVAAWVRFPALTIQTLSQRYTRVAANHYRYESEGGFERELDVDDDGIVTCYPGGWETIA